MSEHVVSFPSRRFQGAAAHYLQGRPSYAPGLFRRVAELTGLERRHRVLDLGCGPGQIASALAYFAGAVVAMDPEPEMLAIGAARIDGVLSNVTFVEGGSEDLGPAIAARFGAFRLVTIGRAFHWMDRAETLRRLDGLVEAEGAVVVLTTQHPEVAENAWMAEYRAIRRRYSGEERSVWRQPGAPTHEMFLLESAFCRLERIGVIERRRVPAGRIVDRALSMSSSTRTRLGGRAEELASEVAMLAERVGTDGMVEEVVESVALVGVRA